MNSIVIRPNKMTSWKSFVESFSQTLLFGRREATTGNTSALAGYECENTLLRRLATKTTKKEYAL